MTDRPLRIPKKLPLAMSSEHLHAIHPQQPGHARSIVLFENRAKGRQGQGSVGLNQVVSINLGGQKGLVSPTMSVVTKASAVNA